MGDVNWGSGGAFGLQNEVMGGPLGCKMRSWGHVGEVIGDHGTQDDHSGGPNGQNLENLRFLKVFRGRQI